MTETTRTSTLIQIQTGNEDLLMTRFQLEDQRIVTIPLAKKTIPLIYNRSSEFVDFRSDLVFKALKEVLPPTDICELVMDYFEDIVEFHSYYTDPCTKTKVCSFLNFIDPNYQVLYAAQNGKDNFSIDCSKTSGEHDTLKDFFKFFDIQWISPMMSRIENMEYLLLD